MAFSESKRSFARLRIAELLILSTAWTTTAVSTVNQKDQNGQRLEAARSFPERESTMHRRTPLLRQEAAAEASQVRAPKGGMIEITSRGSTHSSQHDDHRHNRSHVKELRRRRGGLGDVDCGEIAGTQDGPRGSVALTYDCENYPRTKDLAADAHRMCDEGSDGVTGCRKDDWPEAESKCCDCCGGARYKILEDTNCIGDEGLTPSGEYHSEELKNPTDTTDANVDVKDCMIVCQSMGVKCTAFTYVKTGSDFAAKCFFRMGKLSTMRIKYSDCHEPTCKKSKEQAALDFDVTTPEPEQDPKDHRLPSCEGTKGANTLDNIEPCEASTDPDKVLPEVHPTEAPVPTQDEVVDNRDCYIKLDSMSSE